ncbi:hypothetical protein II898_00360 [bacterium]|nr:hypothetical protein [bacterium]
MKKILACFAVIAAMFLMISCGGDSSKLVNGDDESVSNFGKLGQECYPNETCDKGLICDTEKNICVEDPDNPTDTDQDKPWEQPDENHQETPDNQWEQPDGNHNENPDNQWEQPDENHQENPDNQWEQPDENHQENPDNQWEQPDEDHNETPDEQNNEGKCDPGYVWVDFDLQPYLSSYEGFVDKQCVSCKTTPGMVNYLEGDYYCPGGDDLKGKYIQAQIERCPQYTYVNADYSDCICSYGVPPAGKTCYDLVHGTKKPLIISPKVNN